MPSPGLCRPPFLPAASFESALWLQASSSHFGVPCCRSSASTSTLSGFLVTGVNKSCRRSSRKGNRCKDLRARAWVCQSPPSPSTPQHLVLPCLKNKHVCVLRAWKFKGNISMAFMRAQCSDVLLFVSTNSRGNAPQANGKGRKDACVVFVY
jgi:hypothetical protein